MTKQTPKLEELIKSFLEDGTAKGLGDLSMMVSHIKKVYEAGKPTETNISQLRTWINEKPKDRLVTNEDIKVWLEL